MPVLLNFALFQVGWFACVLGAAHGAPWAGAVVVAAIASTHLFRARRPRQEALLLLLAGMIGASWDTVLAASGAVAFAAGAWIPGAAPYWMVALWINFATTLNVSLSWLKKHLVVAALAGAAGGPLAYFAGAELGALQLLQPVPALLALALGWGILTPLLLLIARNIDGYSRDAHAAGAREARHA